VVTPNWLRSRLAANLRAARARADVGQEELAAAMRALGFDTWLRQTVSASEHEGRRILAEEIFGLASALGITPAKLMDVADD
jgi:transcriptional regulator with XRE-family HTH domain